MTQYWIIIERLENWRVDKSSNFAMFGLSSRYQRAADRIQKGDLIFGYVSSGVSSFSDARVATEAGAKPLRRISDYDAAFDLYIATAPYLVLDRAHWLPMKCVLDVLELTRARAEWRHLFRTSLRQISAHDGMLLKSKLEDRRHRP